MWSDQFTGQTNHYMSITRVSIATRLCRMMTFPDGLQHIMSHNPLIKWPYEIRGPHTGGDSACNRLSCHQLFVRFEMFNF